MLTNTSEVTLESNLSRLQCHPNARDATLVPALYCEPTIKLLCTSTSNSCSMVTSVHGICSPSVNVFQRAHLRKYINTRAASAMYCDVTMLQVTCILVVLTFGLLLNCSWQSCYHDDQCSSFYDELTCVGVRTRTVTASSHVVHLMGGVLYSDCPLVEILLY